jgi:CheY-like chemotaxis protein
MMFEIYVVEDDEEVSESIREILEEAGFRVTQAPDAVTALARLKSGYRPAAMIVDVVLPAMSGTELLRACRDDPALAGIPAVVVSAIRPPDLGAQEAARFVAKPFTVDRLLDALLACFDDVTSRAG